MSVIVQVSQTEAASVAVAALERGDVLLLRDLPFAVAPDETAIFSPDILSSSKNTSFDPSTGRVSGTTLAGAELERLRTLMARFSAAASDLAHRVLPAYGDRLVRARSS